MIVKDPGHSYVLDTYDGEVTQTIIFLKRQGDLYPGNVTSNPGTNCQEVIRVLIDRITYLNEQIPSPRNSTILTCLRVALLEFEFRAMERHNNVEHFNPCKICGHILCDHI